MAKRLIQRNRKCKICGTIEKCDCLMESITINRKGQRNMFLKELQEQEDKEFWAFVDNILCLDDNQYHGSF